MDNRLYDNRLYVQEESSMIVDAIAAMSIAGMGGLVGWLRRKRKKNFGTFAAAVITAAFTVLLSHLLTDWMGLDVHLQYAISGGILLDAVATVLVHMVHKKAADMSGHNHNHSENHLKQ